MKNWLIVDPDSLASIQALNGDGYDNFNQLTPILLTDGRYVLSADILSDDGHTGTWEAYATILQALSQETFDISTLIPTSTT